MVEEVEEDVFDNDKRVCVNDPIQKGCEAYDPEETNESDTLSIPNVYNAETVRRRKILTADYKPTKTSISDKILVNNHDGKRIL